MDEFDVLVVGSGTGGQTAAFELKDAGLNVAVSEKSDRPGGTCALRGCQPKKWFYEATETVAKSRHLRGKGIMDPAVAKWPDIRAQINHFTSHVPENTINAFRDAGIRFLPGSASFLSRNTMEVDGKSIAARYYILATGAMPMDLPIKGSENIITSDEFLELEDLPKSILFVGGGFISCEFAHFAARLGPDNIQVRIDLGARSNWVEGPPSLTRHVAFTTKEGICCIPLLSLTVPPKRQREQQDTRQVLSWLCSSSSCGLPLDASSTSAIRGSW